MADQRTRLIHEIRAVVRGAKEVERLADNMGHVERRAGRQYGDPTGRLRRGLRGTLSQAVSLQSALAGVGVVLAGREIVQAGLAMERLKRSLESVTGSSEAAAAEFEFVRETANRLGLDLRQAGKEYTQLAAAAKGTALEGQQTREIFEAIGTASLALGLRAEETAGALNAVQQIISKGNVSAEELRQQLGERLPGAFRIAAESIGVTTAELNKMLEQGELTAEELLPALARALKDRFGPAAREAAGSAQQQFAQFRNEVFELGSELSESLLPELVETTRVLREELSDPQVVEGLQNVVGALGTLVTWLAKAAAGVSNFVQEFAEGFARLQGFTGGLEDMRDRVEDINEQIENLQAHGTQGAAGAANRVAIEALRRERAALEEQIEVLEGVVGADSGGGTPGFGQPGSFNVMRRPGDGDGSSGDGDGTEIVDRADRGFGQPGSFRRMPGSERALERHRQSLRAAEEAFDATRTAAERYNARVEELRTLLERGYINQQTFNRAVAQAKTELEQAGESAQETGDELSQFAIQAARSMQGAFADFLFDPFEDGLEGMADQFVVALRRMAAEAAAAKILDDIFNQDGSGGSGGGATEGFAAFLGSLFSFGSAQQGGVVGQGALPQRVADPRVFIGAPHFANGGMAGLAPNEVPIIAHRGEEILPPTDPRHRDNAGRGGGDTFVQNVYAQDAGSFRRSRSAMRRDARELMTRGRS